MINSWPCGFGSEIEAEFEQYSRAIVPNALENLPVVADDEIEEDENNSYAGRPKDVHISIRDFEGFVYFGTILEGNKQKGRGVFRYVHKNGDWKGKVAVYEGEFENGRMEGHGTSTDASGCVYTGSFHRGAAHGFGTCIWSENWRYEGEVRPKMRNSEFMRAITDSLL